MSGVLIHRGIEYGNVPGFRPLELDLYLPAASVPGPVTPSGR